MRSLSSDDNEEEAFVSSFLYEGTFEGVSDGVLLGFLPQGGKNMPPKTRRLINRITSDYMYGIQSSVDLSEFLDIVETEYDILSPVKMTVNNSTFDGSNSQEEQLAIFLSSMSVIYQLPKEITLKLFDNIQQPNNSDEKQSLAEFRSAFQAGGWESVVFPTGLGIRLKNRVLSLVGNGNGYGLSRFSPASRLPWRSRSPRRAAEAAKQGVMAAAKSKPPVQNVMTKEELLNELENEMIRQPANQPVATGPGFLSLDDALPSFPAERYGMAWTRVKHTLMKSSSLFSNNKAWKIVSETMETQYQKMKAAGRAGLLAYAFINFALYTVGISWQWRRIPLEMPSPSSGVTLASLMVRKFVKAFAKVYFGASLFKLVRIGASLALAPAAGRVLQYTQRKLKVNANTAIAILITLLVKTFLGTMAVVCLGDSALRRTLSLSTRTT